MEWKMRPAGEKVRYGIRCVVAGYKARRQTRKEYCEGRKPCDRGYRMQARSHDGWTTTQPVVVI